jgi:hypothetical protein
MMNQLKYGVEYDGACHYDFDVRLPVVRDSINAIQEAVEVTGKAEGVEYNMVYRIGVVASALLALGTIPKDAITTEFLIDNLTDHDLDIIDTTIEELKKKRQRGKNTSKATGKTSSCSDNTASVKTVSNP